MVYRGSACLEPGPSQATFQDAYAEMHLRVYKSPRLVCSNRPEGRVLSCFDPSTPQAIPAICVQRLSISVQGPALRAVPVFTKVAEVALVPLREWGILILNALILNHLNDWHIQAQSQDQLFEQWYSCTSAGWVFGSTGKRANSPRHRGSLFSV